MKIVVDKARFCFLLNFGSEKQEVAKIINLCAYKKARSKLKAAF